MFESILRVIFGVISVALLIGAFVGAEGFEDSDSESAMLPPCSVDEGLPFIDDDEVTCYWGMSEEILELPSEIDLAEVLIQCNGRRATYGLALLKHLRHRSALRKMATMSARNSQSTL